MSWPSIKQIADQVKSGTATAESFVKLALTLAEQKQDYNAILRLNPDAVADAKKIDQAIAEGKKVGRLAGVPFLAKDNYLTKGLETTAASNILKGYVPPYDATIIEIMKNAGAILIGKTNLDAFAHGSSTENSDFGVTKNPHDKTRVAGGSSGGSAAAVALGVVPLALGSDTGGSIRQPASFCGVVGLKPSYGLTSRYGVVAMASSTDVMGPITASVTDSAYILDIMAQKDWHDSTMIETDKDGYTDNLNSDLKGVKIGLAKQFFTEAGFEPEVLSAIKSKLEQAEASGATLVELDMPASDSALAVYYVSVSAEVSSNLSRYDGLRYGPRAKADNLAQTYYRTRTKGFNAENKRRIIIGTYVLSSGFYNAYYLQAQKVRTIIRKQFEDAFKKVDVLVCPTAPTTAFKIGEKQNDPLAMYMSDVLTVAPSLIGLPAISIPAGLNQHKLPIGLQLIAPALHDRRLLELALAFEELN